MPTNEIAPLQFVHRLEEIASETIKSSYPRYWNEDFISRSFLLALEKALPSVALAGPELRRRIHWSAWKQVGSAENKFGDIAVLVRIVDADGLVLEGVGFLEAKRRYPGSEKYDQLASGQLTRIEEHAPHAMLLLYDYEEASAYTKYQLYTGHRARLRDLIPPVTNDGESLGIAVVEETHPFSGVFSTHMLVTPIGLIRSINLVQAGLYRYATPLSLQLAMRFLNGFDLEFSREALRTAKGWLDSIGSPRYLLTITVVPTPQPEGRQLHHEGINTERYIRIQGHEG